MENVYSLEEAEEWFLSNSDGAVICMKNGIGEVCTTYQGAVNFYDTKGE